jgi:hypothetical protein
MNSHAASYVVVVAIAAALTVCCERTFCFALWAESWHAKWQCLGLIAVIGILVIMVARDLTGVLRMLSEHAIRPAHFWRRARLFFSVSCIVFALLLAALGRTAYHSWQLRFVRRGQPPVVQLQTDYRPRFLRAAMETAKRNHDFWQSTERDKGQAPPNHFQMTDPTDNPAVLLVDRPPDHTSWDVHEPEPGFLVATLLARWTNVSARPGSCVVFFGEDLGIGLFDAVLSERYWLSADGWLRLDGAVDVEPHWQTFEAPSTSTAGS